MMRTTATYIQQRFSFLWLGLGVFLQLYIFGVYSFEFRRAVLFPFILTLLFILRLFDDLENRENDIKKPNRIYTSVEKCFQLRRLLSITIPVYLFFALWLSKYLAISIGIFLFINLLLYQNLLIVKQWRFILPLLKYPFICLVFGTLVSGISLPLILQSISLFAAFLLVETKSDHAFQMQEPMKIMLFLLSFCFLITGEFSPLLFMILLAFTGAGFYIIFYSKHKFSPHIFLAILLLIRLIYSYEF